MDMLSADRVEGAERDTSPWVVSCEWWSFGDAKPEMVPFDLDRLRIGSAFWKTGLLCREPDVEASTPPVPFGGAFITIAGIK